MASKHLLLQANAELFDKIKEELHEDSDVLEKQIGLFKEWLRREAHLPEDVDESVISNFVRHCKCDLDKAKRKFEKFLQVRIKLKEFFSKRNLDDAYFESAVHKQLVPIPQLGRDGYRYGFVRPPKNVDQFDFTLTFHFAMIIMDLLFLEDTCAGYVGLFDLTDFTHKHLTKLHIKLLLQAIDLIYNVSPFRIKAIHFLNVPTIVQALLSVTKRLLTKKMQSRVFAHNDREDLAKYMPMNVIPKDYGGDGESLDKIADDMKEYFTRETNWQDRIKNLNVNQVKTAKDIEIERNFGNLTID